MSSIEYGVTHEVVLEDGTTMWVKTSQTTEASGRFPTQGEWDSLVDEVNKQSVRAIERTATHLKG